MIPRSPDPQPPSQIQIFQAHRNDTPNPDTVVEAVLPIVAESAIETAIDVLVAQNEDPDIGERLVLAARARGWSAPILLSKAYAMDIATTAGTTEAVAAPLIIAAESEFRHQIESYGAALSLEKPVDTLSQQGAELAKLLLAAEQGVIVDIPVDLMKEIVNTALDVVSARQYINYTTMSVSAE